MQLLDNQPPTFAAMNDLIKDVFVHSQHQFVDLRRVKGIERELSLFCHSYLFSESPVYPISLSTQLGLAISIANTLGLHQARDHIQQWVDNRQQPLSDTPCDGLSLYWVLHNCTNDLYTHACETGKTFTKEMIESVRYWLDNAAGISESAFLAISRFDIDQATFDKHADYSQRDQFAFIQGVFHNLNLVPHNLYHEFRESFYPEPATRFGVQRV